MEARPWETTKCGNRKVLLFPLTNKKLKERVALVSQDHIQKQ